MITRHHRLFIAGASALTLFAICAAIKAEPFLYVSAGAGLSLARIDVGTGAVSGVGTYNQPFCEAIAISPQGKLFTVTDSFPRPGTQSKLASVDLSSGTATPIGPSLEGEEFMGLSFSPDGVLYGINSMSGTPDHGSLYRFNPDTGVPTKVGVTGGCFEIMDIAFHPDGTMYGAAWDSLYRIDRNTGQAELVTKAGNLQAIMGLAIDDDGNIYVTEIVLNAPLWLLDPASGATTRLFDTGLNKPHGLEFIPTPRSRPVSLGFWKSAAVASPCDMAGRVDMELNGSEDGTLCYLQVPDSGRVAGRTIHFSGDYLVDTPFYSFTARLNVVLNGNNGTIRGEGLVTNGWLDGTQVHLEAQAEPNGAAGVIRLMPGSAD